MHQMLKKQAVVLAALFVTCFVSVSADTPRKMTLEEAKNKTFNLQAHEKRINAFHDKMTRDGKANELSKEFVAVHQGMKKGTYKYDLATARKVMQEMNAKRMPAAPKNLQQRIQTQK